jgi:hypothetical protein
MIHGQILGGKGAVAVRTDTVGKTIPPPLRLAECLRFPFFSGDMPRIVRDVNPVSHVTSFFSLRGGWYRSGALRQRQKKSRAGTGPGG